MTPNQNTDIYTHACDMSAKLLYVLYTYISFSGMQISPSESATYICITLNTATRFHWW